MRAQITDNVAPRGPPSEKTCVARQFGAKSVKSSSRTAGWAWQNGSFSDTAHRRHCVPHARRHNAGGRRVRTPGYAPAMSVDAPEEQSPYGAGSRVQDPATGGRAETSGATPTPRKVRIPHLHAMKAEGRRWAMLTAYDMYAAQIF